MSTTGHESEAINVGGLKATMQKFKTDKVDAPLSGKQDTIADLSDIRSGASAGATAYQKPSTGIPSTDMTAEVQASLALADSAIQDISGKSDVGHTHDDRYYTESEIDAKEQAITDLIPTQATSSNQLADKDFVNSSIATSTATYRGSYNLVSDLHLTITATNAQIATALASAVATADNNDYSFVQVPTANDKPTEIAKIVRFKNNGTAWEYEYELNNSGYTSDQWAAINSGITSGLVSKLSSLPTNSELTTQLGNKVDKVSGKGLSTNDYTTDEKNKLAGIAAGAEVNVQSDWNATSGDALILNKPTIPEAAANGTYTVKTLVGSTTTNVSDFTANQSSADDVTFVQGSNVTITPDATNRKITIAATNTKNTAGTTNKTGTKMFLAAATSQANNPQTYSNSNCYIGTDNCLYSGGTKVLTSHQDISGKADKSATVSTVAYDTTNGKLTKTINGTTTDIVVLDTAPTSGSKKPVTSGAVYQAIQEALINPISDSSIANEQSFSPRDVISVNGTMYMADAATSDLPLTKPVAQSGKILTHNGKVLLSPSSATSADWHSF